MRDILDFVHDNNIAIYVAGDSNIFVPAIVAITSIQKRNLNLFDFFICFDSDNLNAEKISILKKFHINFIDTATLGCLKKALSCEKMKEGAWPKEVLYNWGIPIKLNELNYKTAVKIDYDLLCIEKWNLQEIDPGECVMGAAYWLETLANDNVNAALCEKLDINDEKIKYFNAGFCSINIKRYIHDNVFDKILETYKVLTAPEENVKCAEQVAIGLVLSKISDGLKKINSRYNVRVTTIPEVVNGKADITNLHFVTSNKPWKEISFKYLPYYITIGNRAHLYMYRNIWINEALSIKEINHFLNVKRMSDTDYLRMLSTIFKSLYQYQNKLKNEQ